MIGLDSVGSLRERFARTFLGRSLLRMKLQLSYPVSGRAIYRSRYIQGWLSDPEADRLYTLAKENTPDRGAVVLEIGSWRGKSSSVIATGLRGKSDARLYCLDPFGADEDPEHQAQYYSGLVSAGEDGLETFRKNMDSCGVSDIVAPIKGYSFEIIKSWSTPIDFLFIDANHKYEAVLRDFLLWAPWVKKGGILALHDTVTWPGPTQVAQENLVGPQYGQVQTIDTLTWARKNI